MKHSSFLLVMNFLLFGTNSCSAPHFAGKETKTLSWNQSQQDVQVDEFIKNTCAEIESFALTADLKLTDDIQKMLNLSEFLQEKFPYLSEKKLSDKDFTVPTALCLHNISKIILQKLDQYPETALENQKKLIAKLLTLTSVNASKLNLYARKVFNAIPLSELLQDAALRDAFSALHMDSSLEEIANWLKGQDVEKIDQAALLKLGLFASNSHINDVHNPYSFLEKYSSFVISQSNAAQQHLMLQLVSNHLLTNGVIFSSRGKETQEKLLLRVLQSLQKKLSKLEKESPEYDTTLQYIAEYNKILEEIRAIPYSLGTMYAKLAESLREKGMTNADFRVNEAKESSRILLEKGYPHKGLLLQEGDIWLVVSQNGPGDLFSNLAALPDFVTHSGVIASDWEDGMRYYFRAEISDGPTVSAIDTSFHTVFVRPTFPVAPGATTQALQNLARYPKVLFDVGFQEGLFDKKGNVSVYCSEFVHFLFQNKFQPDLGPFPSPFDGTRTRLHITNPVTYRNGMRLGFPVGAQVFIPDTFLYSPSTQILGAFLTETVPISKTNDDLELFIAEMRGKFNDEFAQLFHAKDMKEVSYWEKRSLDVYLIGRELSEWFPFLGKKLPQAGMNSLNLPDGEAKYHMLNFFRVYAAFNTSLENIGRQDANGAFGAEWKELYLQRYQETIVPLMHALFQD
jgi:hypothetical protein